MRQRLTTMIKEKKSIHIAMDPLADPSNLEGKKDYSSDVWKTKEDDAVYEKEEMPKEYREVEMFERPCYAYIETPATYYENVKRSIPKMISAVFHLINRYQFAYNRLYFLLSHQKSASYFEMELLQNDLDLWMKYIKKYVTFMQSTFGHLIDFDTEYNLNSRTGFLACYKQLVVIGKNCFGLQTRYLINEADTEKFEMAYTKPIPKLFSPMYNKDSYLSSQDRLKEIFVTGSSVDGKTSAEGTEITTVNDDLRSLIKQYLNTDENTYSGIKSIIEKRKINLPKLLSKCNINLIVEQMSKKESKKLPIVDTMNPTDAELSDLESHIPAKLSIDNLKALTKEQIISMVRDLYMSYLGYLHSDKVANEGQLLKNYNAIATISKFAKKQDFEDYTLYYMNVLKNMYGEAASIDNKNESSGEPSVLTKESSFKDIMSKALIFPEKSDSPLMLDKKDLTNLIKNKVSLVMGNLEENASEKTISALTSKFNFKDMRKKITLITEYFEQEDTLYENVSVDLFLCLGEISNVYNFLLEKHNRKPVQVPLAFTNYISVKGIESNKAALYLVISYDLGG